jgi:hypothetical protein
MQRKDSKRREGSSNEPSRVLLVCIYDTVVLNITNEMLYETFVGHGTLDKLLVFEKGQVTKAFVQFADVQEAERVLSLLSDRPNRNSTVASCLVPTVRCTCSTPTFAILI